jgi:hypothetical protein
MHIALLPSSIPFAIASQSDTLSGKPKKELKHSYELGIAHLNGLFFELFHLFLSNLDLLQLEFYDAVYFPFFGFNHAFHTLLQFTLYLVNEVNSVVKVIS